MAEDAAPAVPSAGNVKPQKPDEAAFKEKVAKLEKEHTQVKTQLVRYIPRSLIAHSTATWPVPLYRELSGDSRLTMHKLLGRHQAEDRTCYPWQEP